MSDTLLLDTALWDLCADANGNIAVATLPYSAAQDAASAIRCFLGELWYDTSQGIPYIQQVLGKYPPLSLLRSLIASAALSVPSVAKARVRITSVSDRTLQGQVIITDVNGDTAAANF